MTRYLCPCGAPATAVCDIGKSRVLRCAAHAEGVVVEGAEAAMESDSCWCGMRAAGWDVPACPVHGLSLTY